MAYSTGYTVARTANENMFRHRESIRKEKKIMKKHELTTNVQNNIKPPLHDATRDQLAMARSVYGVRLRPIPREMRVFDRIFKMPADWDPKVKHDAYRNLRQNKLNAREDDANREIVVLANSEPGHRLSAPPQAFTRDHARVAVYHHSVFRTNGVNLDNHKR